MKFHDEDGDSLSFEDVISEEISLSKARIYALIENRCRGMRISVGKQVAKARRKVLGRICDCGTLLSDGDEWGGVFVCRSCGKEQPLV